MTLSQEEKQQYSRHLILEKIGLEGQIKLKQAKVLVIGAGGLGCPVLQYLTAAGVGTIGIIDHDTVDQSNLQRQVIYTHDDIGTLKVSAAISKLSKLNPFIKFNGYPEQLTTENALELFKKYDIIVDGSDNFPTRYLVSDASVITNKPLVFGSIYKFEGQLSVFNYKGGPTYRCLFPTPPKPNEVPNCSEIGVLGVLPGIIGSIQANEVVKIIVGIGEVISGKLLTFNTLDLSSISITFKKNSELKITELNDNYTQFCNIMESTFELEYENIKNNLSHYYLIDVREEWEREEFNIGGVHIPVHQIPTRFNEINTEKPLLIYCQSGNRSNTAKLLLEDIFDSENIFTIKGGVSNLNS